MSESKNDVAWEVLFERFKIDQVVSNEGHFIIKANQINEEREARLMTKFDHKSQLPKIFSKNNLSILPISRGGYIISTIETFHDFEEGELDIVKINAPSFLESLDYKNINSEATAINCAFVSGILAHFTADDELKPTVSGRMSSSTFNFNINSANGLLKVEVGNSQIEIDGGYEGLNTLNLIEAKNYVSKDFLVRQLFYPYKLWYNKIKKAVKPIFLTYTNGIFHLREYAIQDVSHYNSLKLVNQQKYTIQEEALNIQVIQKINNSAVLMPEPAIPFPQANSFERVINLCEQLEQRTTLSKEEITQNYDFNERQTNYYTDAGRYLGLIEKRKENNQIQFYLTKQGNRLFKLSLYDRQKEFIKLILSHVPFKKTLDLYFSKINVPSHAEVVLIMKESNLYKVDSEETFYRRASSILGWINWIINQVEE